MENKKEQTVTQKVKRQLLPVHPLSPLEKEYIASLTPELKKLHNIATENLASSYFVKSTHGFKKWLAQRSS